MLKNSRITFKYSENSLKNGDLIFGEREDVILILKAVKEVASADFGII